MMHPRVFLFALLTLLGAALQAPAQVISLNPPGPREFIVDIADLITPEDEARIRQQCDALLSEMAIPIIVVAIPAKERYNGGDLRVETFANMLFDQWQIGYQNIEGVPWNRGILFLVSSEDREARIELGADWERRYDATAAQIMDENILPYFRSGDYSAGITAGVDALDKMARGLELPQPPASAAGSQSSSNYGPAPGPGIGGGGLGSLLGFGGFGALALFSRLFGGGRSRYYPGRSGRAGSGSGSSWSGGGFGRGSFGGGSFGGGFSGRGGATGRW